MKAGYKRVHNVKLIMPDLEGIDIILYHLNEALSRSDWNAYLGNSTFTKYYNVDLKNARFELVLNKEKDVEYIELVLNEELDL